MSKAVKWMVSGAAIIGIFFFIENAGGGHITPLLLIGAGALFYGGWLQEISGDRKKATTVAAFSEGFAYAFQSEGDGIAISPERGIVKVQNRCLTGAIVKEYPFEEIRRWHINKAAGGEIVAIGNVGFIGGIGALGHNRRNSAKNRRESGFYLCVKDIDHPEWRIDMPKVPDQQRWMEILQQHINEGVPAPVRSADSSNSPPRWTTSL